MEITYNEVKKLPVVYIDNFYDSHSCEQIWQELQFINSCSDKMKGPEHTYSATTEAEGKLKFLKNNKGVFLDDVYNDRSISSILKTNRKTFSEQVLLELASLHYFFNYLKTVNIDKTLINYYENSHYYDSHRDNGLFTTLTYFYQKPKRFTGGELIIEKELNIDCVYNRFVIFPSILLHEVTPIYIKKDLQNKNLGRYSMTQLMTSVV